MSGNDGQRVTYGQPTGCWWHSLARYLAVAILLLLCAGGCAHRVAERATIPACPVADERVIAAIETGLPPAVLTYLGEIERWCLAVQAMGE